MSNSLPAVVRGPESGRRVAGPVPGRSRTGKALLMTRFRARAAVILIASALTCTAAAAPALAAPGPVPTKSEAASGWLARQMVNRSHFVTVFKKQTFPNQGETIDAILAFAATKSANGYGARATAWLQRPSVLTGYIGDGTSSSFAGATAKAALAAEVRGLNPASFGQANLVKRLGKLLTKSGRYSDHSKFGDFSNAFSQSLAIIALTRHGGAPAIAANFLIGTECQNGGFPLNFGGKTCTSDTDSTALAAQALLASGHKAAALRGLAWLGRQQHGGGGVDATGGKVPNANTTGLAGEAFAAAGQDHRATLAGNFLRRLQLGCRAKLSRRGAIPFDSTGFVESTATDATAQGILGLADVSLAKITARGSSSGAPQLSCAITRP
jgi:hypothetical protein